MPTSAAATFSANGVVPLKYGHATIEESINLKASSTFAAGALVGELTGTPGAYATYASGNSDGSQLCSHILRYACKTDSAGNVTLGDGTAGQEWGQTSKGAPAFLPNRQVWNCADIPNLDANAVTVLNGVLLKGSVSAGEVSL